MKKQISPLISLPTLAGGFFPVVHFCAFWGRFSAAIGSAGPGFAAARKWLRWRGWVPWFLFVGAGTSSFEMAGAATPASLFEVYHEDGDWFWFNAVEAVKGNDFGV